MPMPAVTYIVSAFDRPNRLPCCLWSLKAQTDRDFEVIVADNSYMPEVQKRHQFVVESLRLSHSCVTVDGRFRHINTAHAALPSWASPAWDCYWSAEWVVEHEAQGEYICLPSDDSYYVPIFQETMLAKARASDAALGLVYCDMLYDRRLFGKYAVLDVQPKSGLIDKTGFMVRRDHWIGFPNKNTTALGPSRCDGEMVEELVRRGVRHGKVHEVLAVHN